MRLADFIVSNKEQILSEWEAFARTLWPASQAMNIEELRDHADGILSTIAVDLETAQSKEEQSEKSKGHTDPGRNHQTEAAAHGAVRAGGGFTLAQMISEFRALRASVIRLWMESGGVADSEELTRFNEAVDQALAQSARQFVDDLEHSKDLFLGILGHDLQNPLSAIMVSAGQMLRHDPPEGPYQKASSRILRSAIRMGDIIGDLLDFTRARLGTGMPISRNPKADLAEISRDTVEELQSAFSDSMIRLELSGDLRGSWDAARIGQALSNLVGNAIRHGARGGPITVRAEGGAGEIVLSVHNTGPVIPRGDLNRIFLPLKRLATDPMVSGLGLGLFIAKEIVVAHGGIIEVESTHENGTTFTVHLPRNLEQHEEAAAAH